MANKQILFDKLEIFLHKHALIKPHDHIIVGLSGGPDSVFLLYFLHSIKEKYALKLTAAHFDHQWQVQSADMAQFCVSLAQDLQIPIIVKKADELGKQFKKTGSQEELGRNMRRYFFQELKENLHADKIALAHHAQDQQETFFIRLIRGATLDGLCAMKPYEKEYIRPLLYTNKENILRWLQTKHISFITDPTNSSLEFLRNRIRIEVLPALMQCDLRFNENFLRTLENLQKNNSFLQDLTTHYFEEIAFSHENIIKLDLEKFKILPDLMQDRVLVYWLIQEQVPFQLTQDFLYEIKRFLFQGKKSLHAIHEMWIIEKKNHVFLIKKMKKLQ